MTGALDRIGFYTLSDERARTASKSTPLTRCELVLTARCNFACPYCRHVGREMTFEDAARTVTMWAKGGLRNVRFSGGEPTLWDGLVELVELARKLGIGRVALSTNGSAEIGQYMTLVEQGVNDLSISLDACCAADGDKLAGMRRGAWGRVVSNIRALSPICYVTVGVVLTEDNAGKVEDIIRFAHGLGVADIRIIPAAQRGTAFDPVRVDQGILDSHPILAYRVANINSGLAVRGMRENDAHRCGLVLDDMAVTGGLHYPCIIYMREGGEAIGRVGNNMRRERAEWSQTHDTHADQICRNNCLDVCVDYNNSFAMARKIA
jgi:pyruvate-formate lyase-activating enzyme